MKIHRGLSIVVALLSGIASGPVKSQNVTTSLLRDGSVGPGTDVQPVRGPSGIYQIGETMGTRSGANLFHSFQTFNIGVGDTALFTADLPTSNVITRVTGGSSSIYGSVRSSIPGANLFFLNPAGIFFGPNSSVNVQGSFHASTANVLRMKDQDGNDLLAFSKESLLRFATPSAFGFLSDHPAPLTVNGSQFSVPNGSNISLTGGGIAIQSGKLTARGGGIGLVSVASQGDVVLGGKALSADGFQNLGDIRVTDNSSLNVSEYSNRAGVVSIRGGRFVFDHSQISADVSDGSGGAVDIHVTEDIVLSNGAKITSTTDGKGNAPSIHLEANSVEISNGSVIDSTVSGSGNGSDITIDATGPVLIANRDPNANAYATGLHSDVSIGADGAGGTITVSTPSLTLQRGVISSETVGFGPDYPTLGRPGDIRIATDQLRMSDAALISNRTGTFDLSGSPTATHEIGIHPLHPQQNSSITLTGYGTAIQSTALLSTQGGAQITLEATNVSLTDRAFVSTTVYGGSANAGAIAITADRVSIVGGSQVTSETDFGGGSVGIPTGNSGNIGILARDSILLQGSGVFPLNGATYILPSQISTSTSGAGVAGNITLAVQNPNHAGTIILDQGVVDSGNASPFAKAAAGLVSISAPSVTIANEALVGSYTYGPGKGGNVRIGRTPDLPIDTVDLTLQAGGFIAVSTIKDSSHPGGGDAGSVDINVARLSLQDGGQIFANTVGGSTGAGGSITVKASQSATLAGRDPNDPEQVSKLEVSTGGTGAAGNIAVYTPELTVANGARIVAASNSAATNAGAAGSIFIGTPANPVHNITLSEGEISAFAVQGPGAGEPREGNIHLSATGLVLLEKNSSITAGVQNGLGGDITVDGPNQMVMRDASSVLATTEIGTGGRIEIGSKVFIPSADSVVSADAGIGTAGVVTITAPQVDLQGGLTAAPVSYVDASALLRPSCEARRSNRQAASFLVERPRALPLSEDGLLPTFVLPPAGPCAGEIEPGNDTLVLAQRQQWEGDYATSSNKLSEALKAAEESGDRTRLAAILDSQANAYLALGQPEEAQKARARAEKIAGEPGNERLLASLRNNKGNWFASQEQYPEALQAYADSAALARKAGDPLTEATALANSARAAIDAESRDREPLLRQAVARVEALDAGPEKDRLRIHLAGSYEQMASTGAQPNPAHLQAAYRLLETVVPAARESGDDRTLASALGHLGTLYQREHRYPEALYSLREALRAAESAGASELLYRWRWREGQVLWAQGSATRAIESYWRAVKTLEETRQEALRLFGSTGGYFRDRIAPVYLDLVDALLRAADTTRDTAVANELTLDARSIVEKLKAAELRDFYHDECVDYLKSRMKDLDKDLKKFGSQVAIVYPILLPDRLELLVTLPSGLQRFRPPIPVGKEQVTALAAQFLGALQRHSSGVDEEYRAPARKLYKWLVKPYARRLREEHIDTILFVPDGPLRTIPMAALHDGAKFLMETYAVAVVPGLQLVDPQRLPRAGVNTLAGGLTVAALGEDPLPFVRRELDEFQAIYGVKPLRDEDFTAQALDLQMRQTRPSIVNIASHAQFSGDPEKSWILTYNEKVSIRKFSEMMGVAKYRETPLELLVLSACQTAEGDERAALGLSGVALRAGARSALGSLWPVAGDATALLVPGFYRALQNPSVSRALALSLAQRELLKNHPEFRHPYFWSPFLLIGNWL